MSELISFIIDNRATLAALGSAILGIIVRKVEKKKIVNKYENLLKSANGKGN